MVLSQKCQYAFRAVFELSRRYTSAEPVSVSEIAETQAIPARFLEQILAELKQGGFVTSRRGAQGGYNLVVSPAELKVGDIIRFVEGPITPVKCIVTEDPDCALYGVCIFQEFWERAKKAVESVYDGTTFLDLVHDAEKRDQKKTANYSI